MRQTSGLVMHVGEAMRRHVFHLLDAASKASVSAQCHELQRVQHMSLGELHDWQGSKLFSLLNHARDSVSFYQSHIPRDFSAEESWAILESLPVISREDLEATPEAFLSNRYRGSDLYANYTSGSVGHALPFWTDRVRRKRVLSEVVYFGRWAKYELGMRHVFLRQTMPESTKSRLRLWPKNQVLYNTSVLNEENLREIIGLLETSRAKILFAYPWTLHTLALYLRRNPRTLINHSLKSVIALGGALLPDIRALVEESLGVEIFERYSTLELGIIGSECEKHCMHLNTGSLYLEGSMPDWTAADGGRRSTDVIVTDLFNYGMPLLRYDLGDRIEFAPGDCTCGRRSPLISRIYGRMVDQITTPGGEWVDPLRIGHHLRDIPSLRQYQFIQYDADHYVLRAVTQQTLLPEVRAEVRRRYSSLLGAEAKVDVVEVDEIYPLPSGKRPFIVNEMMRNSRVAPPDRSDCSSENARSRA